MTPEKDWVSQRETLIWSALYGDIELVLNYRLQSCELWRTQRYEAITEEEYNELTKDINPYDPELLLKYERSESIGELEVEDDPDCINGVCPIR